LYTLLIQNNIIEYLQIIAENSTSAYPSILSTDIANLEFTFPSIKEQHNIANILFFLSQKIALNKAINHNLAVSHYWHFTLPSPDHSSKEGVTRPAA
ncbi:MAG: restriction endonuclease subunit S, partial [Capnocytophaga granulosa]